MSTPPNKDDDTKELTVLDPPEYSLPPLDNPKTTFLTLQSTPTNWGMGACRVDSLRGIGGDGEGITVAVLDTGCDVNHEQFQFAGKIVGTKSFINGQSVADGNGHGTHCCGTVLGVSTSIGVANKAKLLVGKVLSNQGSGSSTGINAGIRWAADNGANVISMSLGGGGADPNQESAIQYAMSKGVLVLAASGNSRPNRTEYPGRYCLSVAACDQSGRVASFSSPGQTKDTLLCCTPGVGIYSAAPGGGYQQMSGTSMATPFAAGVVAGLLSVFLKKGMPFPSNKQLYDLFHDWAIDAGVAGPDVDYGSGLIDCRALVRYFDTPKMGL